MPGNADRSLALQLLTAAVAAAGKAGKAAVAERLGYGRSLISRVLSPNDKAGMSNALAQRVIDIYHVIPVCPATGATQPRAECLRLASSPAPMHHPTAMRNWRICQTCAHKPRLENAQ